MRRAYLLVGLLLTLAMASTVFAQRADRGIITGLVTDPSGAAVPQASVTIINEDTGVPTDVQTTAAGNYGSPPLTLGPYTVRVEKEGFKTFVRTGILLEGGITYRQDATLEIGATATTIEVTAASEMINVSTAEVGHSLGAKYYEDLPVVMGADIRLAESLLWAQPGYVPMAPNGDAMFRGSQFHSRINGGQTMATENWMDGAAFGYARGHQQTQESSPPYEAIREVKVINSSFSAQYGHTSGAFIEYVSKSGTNDWHGSVFEYLGNSALNARRTFEGDIPDPVTGVPEPGTAVRPTKNNEYGFSLGGPIKKDKAFFFTNLEFMNLRQIVSSGYIWNMPTAQLKTGDFSPLLDTTTLRGTDILGRPVYDGEIFDPSTTRVLAAGQADPITGIVATAAGPVRDGIGFDPNTGLPIAGAANIIPTSHPLRSSVAANWLPLVPLPDRLGYNQNTFGGSGDPHHILDAKTWLVRIDYSFNPSLKMTHTFWTNSRPAIRKCGSAGACDVPNDPFTSPELNDTYISDGFYQRISNRYAHQQFDWVIKPTVFNHTTISYDRWYMGGYSISDGVGWLDKLGISGYPIAAANQGGPPHIGFSGGIYGYTGLGTNWQRGFEAVNRWQFADDLTWIQGRHTIKVGFEWRQHQMNHSGWARGVAGNFNFNDDETAGYDSAGNKLNRTGDPLASLILGQLHDTNFFIGLDHVIYEHYWAPWVNDEIKISDKLTVNFGLRFDYQQPRTERHNRMSSFDPTASQTIGGVTVPGALVYASASNPSFETPEKDSWGPRFGFAYRATGKDVIRGGYGIYYSGVMYDMWVSSPTLGWEASPTAPNLTNGLAPAGCGQSDLVLGSHAASSADCYGWWDDMWPQNRIVFPAESSRTAAFANNSSPLAVSPQGLDLPRYQNWSLTWERQLSPNMIFDVSYVGNHGTRLIASNQALGYPGRNMNDPAILAYGSACLGTDVNDAAAVAANCPASAGIASPYPGFTGNVAQALRPFPEYTGINWRNLNLGTSTYHSLQTKIDKRFSNGLQFRVAYVWSKLIVGGLGDTGNSHDNLGNIQNPIMTRLKAVSTDDVPHTFILTYTYQLPFGPGNKYGSGVGPVLSKFIAGWGVSGIQRYQSGRPLRITMANDMGGLIFNGEKRPNNLCAGGWSGGSFDPHVADAPNGDRWLDSSCWADPGALTFGDAPRVDAHARTFALYNEDISIIKDTYFGAGERYKVRFETQLGNITNRIFYCNPNSDWSSGGFGQVGGQCNIPRRIQFGLRFDF